MMPPRGIGELRFRVRFDKRVETDDPAGGKLSAWTTINTGSFLRWAAFAPLQGSEVVEAQRLDGLRPSTIFVRYDSQTKLVDPSWRVVETNNGDDVRAYDIKSCEDIERQQQFITVYAVAGDADA